MNARLCLLSSLLLSACGGGDQVPAAQGHTELQRLTPSQSATDTTDELKHAAGPHAINTSVDDSLVRESELNDALYFAAYAEHSVDREEAIEYLADSGEPSAVAVLREVALSDNAELRRAAVEALAEIGGDQSAQALGGMLDDYNAVVRVSVVEALEDTNSSNSIGYLQQALSDADSRVRAAAALALEELDTH
ncbi:MAG: HEAT repeat domain-containing protein [Pseudomonadales bacterium]